MVIHYILLLFLQTQIKLLKNNQMMKKQILKLTLGFLS